MPSVTGSVSWLGWLSEAVLLTLSSFYALSNGQRLVAVVATGGLKAQVQVSMPSVTGSVSWRYQCPITSQTRRCFNALSNGQRLVADDVARWRLLKRWRFQCPQ